MSSSSSVSDSRSRLLTHFSSHHPSTHGPRWNALWADGSFLPWDRSAPNPAFVDILAQRPELVGTAFEGVKGELNGESDEGEEKKNKKRRTALVPGCGRGYDVYLLASRGWEAVGLEVSESAVERAREWSGVVKALRERDEEGRGKGREDYEGSKAYEGAERVYDVDEKVLGGMGEGEARFEVGDFFELGGEGDWDLIYDYTFLSALPPSLRPQWAAQMSKLLSLAGRLICIEFPTYKDPADGGPPFALPPEVYEAHLSQPSEELPYGENGRVETQKIQGMNENSLERVAHFQPERTFEIGKGTDWISVWRRKS